MYNVIKQLPSLPITYIYVYHLPSKRSPEPSSLPPPLSLCLSFLIHSKFLISIFCLRSSHVGDIHPLIISQKYRYSIPPSYIHSPLLNCSIAQCSAAQLLNRNESKQKALIQHHLRSRTGVRVAFVHVVEFVLYFYRLRPRLF